jgi:hypothetical protein
MSKFIVVAEDNETILSTLIMDDASDAALALESSQTLWEIPANTGTINNNIHKFDPIDNVISSIQTDEPDITFGTLSAVSVL